MLKLLVVTFLFLVTPVMAQTSSNWSGQGEISLEWRRFENDGKKFTEETGLSVFSRVEAKYVDGPQKHVFRGFARVDRFDNGRDFMSLEDAYFSSFLGEEELWRVLAGYQLFNWTATEAFHPADLINSRNYDSDVENLEKLGELTFQLQRLLENGSLNFYIFPRFERPEYPERSSRLGYGVNIARPHIVQGTSSSTDQWVFQGGLMLNWTFDDADLNVHAIHHVDRNFPLIGTQSYLSQGGATFTTDTDFTPYYYKATQIGGTYQHALAGWLLKLEAGHRIFEDESSVAVLDGSVVNVMGTNLPTVQLLRPEDHTEVAMGIEYPFAHESGAETNLILEASSIFGATKERRARLSIFQRDMMLGARHAFNDEMGTEIFVSFFMDLERSHEHLYNLSYTRRLTDQWKIKSGLRIYDAPQKGVLARGLEALDGDNHLYLNLTRYF